MKVLVTGGGGFLGSRIVRMLSERGDEVTVLGRSDYPELAGLGIPIVRGDVRDSGCVLAAARKQDAVIHTAALAGIWGPYRTYWSINVEGTRNVLAACRAAGVGRLVYTSSPSVVFGGQELRGVDERQPYATRYLAAYPETKAVAEREVLAANDDRLATVALRPHLIWGPGDPHLIPRILDRAARGRLVRVGDGQNQVDITYIDNAAVAHLRAADRLSSRSACAGRAFFISQGEPVRLWAWLGDILSRVGLPGISRHVSFRTAYRVGAVLEGLYRAFRIRREPPMTRFLATQLAKSHYFNIAAARRDLGYAPGVSTAAGMESLLEALRNSPAAIKWGVCD